MLNELEREKRKDNWAVDINAVSTKIYIYFFLVFFFFIGFMAASSSCLKYLYYWNWFLGWLPFKTKILSTQFVSTHSKVSKTKAAKCIPDVGVVFVLDL